MISYLVSFYVLIIKTTNDKDPKNLTLSQKWRTMAFVDSAIALVCDDGLDYKTRIYNDIGMWVYVKMNEISNNNNNWYSQ